MNRASSSGLQIPQIVVTPDREFQRIPLVRIKIEEASSESEDDDNKPQTRTRLRPDNFRCSDIDERVIKRLTSLLWRTNTNWSQLTVYELSALILQSPEWHLVYWNIKPTIYFSSLAMNEVVLLPTLFRLANHSKISSLSIPSLNLWLFEKLQLIYFKTKNFPTSAAKEVFLELKNCD